MAALYEYMIAATVASVIAGISEKLLSSSLRRYVQYITSLVLILFLLAPIRFVANELLTYFQKEPTMIEKPEIEENLDPLVKYTESQVGAMIEKDLQNEFGISTSVKCFMKLEDDGSFFLTKLAVELEWKDRELSQEIKKHLEENYKTETEIIVKEATKEEESYEEAPN